MDTRYPEATPPANAWRIIATFIAVLPLMAGCSLPAMLAGRIEPPTVALHASLVESLSPSTAAVRFALAVDNPNGVGLTVRVVDCRLTVSDQAVVEGKSSSRVTVPAHGAATVELRVEMPYNALSESPDAMMLGEVPYDLDGKLRFGSVLAERELLFAVSSVLRLSPPLGLAGAPRLPSPRDAGRPASDRQS